MSRRSPYRGLGDAPNLPPGYAIVGSCDPSTGQGSGYQTGFYLLAGPNGYQNCTADALATLGIQSAPAPAAAPVVTQSAQITPSVSPASGSAPLISAAPAVTPSTDWVSGISNTTVLLGVGGLLLLWAVLK